jgi:hypothetical protein
MISRMWLPQTRSDVKFERTLMSICRELVACMTSPPMCLLRPRQGFDASQLKFLPIRSPSLIKTQASTPALSQLSSGAPSSGVYVKVIAGLFFSIFCRLSRHVELSAIDSGYCGLSLDLLNHPIAQVFDKQGFDLNPPPLAMMSFLPETSLRLGQGLPT